MPPGHVATAFPAIVKGFAELSKDEGLEAVVDRAINHLLAADGSEALDMRVPIACAGLEMIGWAVLQRDGWVKSELDKMKASRITRLLLGWAHIQTTVPGSLTAVESRRKDLDQTEDAPEVLHWVRNRLVHPPKKLDSPEWPSPRELRESWQLANWYLELAVLRVLGYEGKYWSRLRLGRYGTDLETSAVGHRMYGD